MSRTGTTVEICDLIYLSEEGAPPRRLDVHRPAADRPAGPSVLLWHGIGPDEKDVLAPLAREIASHGLPVLVPDWRGLRVPSTSEHVLRAGRETAAAIVSAARTA